MLDKIIEIKNIGKFIDYSAVGDLKFEKFNLIYADNGTGKTTLSSTVRSLSTNNPKIVIGRKTLGNNEPQTAKLLINNTSVDFKDSVWSQCGQKFEIFDSQFIVDNVFSGNIVDHDHRRNLHKFVIGEHGVALAHKIETLDAEIRQTNSEVNQLTREITKNILGSLSADEFVSLTENSNAEAIAKELELEIQSIEKSEQIKSSRELNKIEVSIDFKSIIDLLVKNFEVISNDAQSKLEAHLQSHGFKGLSWIEHGMTSKNQSDCPFCGQNITGNELVSLYKTILNKEYQNYRKELETLANKYSEQERRRFLDRIKSTLSENNVLVQFWSNFLDVKSIEGVSTETLPNFLLEVTKNIDSLIQKKLLARDSVVEADSVSSIEQTFASSVQSTVDAYNSAIDNLNNSIRNLKASVASANLSDKKIQLIKLKNTPIRYRTDINSNCTKLNQLNLRKSELDTQKNVTRDELDKYADGIFEKYQNSINALLSDFGATFTIADKKENYAGGKPSTTYKLCINGTKFDLEDSSNDESKPSFKNTLSEGEKSTLAFCYFLSKLREDKDLANKVIIFDDPLSSFDLFRREKTKQTIIQLASDAKQVLVFSHDRFFLRLIWDSTQDTKAKCFNLYRKSNGTSMALWDIEKETRSRYLQDYHTLVDYLENGVPNGSESAMRDVARCIRPLIEYNLHLRFPKDFKENEWLGNCIERIRDATQNCAIASLKSQLAVLGSVNDFSKRFHHRDNRNSETEPINDSELRQFVKQGFQIISGIAVAHIN